MRHISYGERIGARKKMMRFLENAATTTGMVIISLCM
jgi:hypothetical protein